MPVADKPGVRSGPANQLKEMKDRMEREKENCDHKFPKGISY